MHPHQDPAPRPMGELNALTLDMIVMAALRGDSYRKLKRLGHLESALRNTGGNQMEAQLLMALTAKLEDLIRSGMEFAQALEWLRNAGWIARIAHHTTIDMRP